MRCIEGFTEFVSQNSKEPRMAALPVKVFARDLYLRARKDYVGLKITLE